MILFMIPDRYINYRNFLLWELKSRQEKNPLYSMRAFARDLNVRSSRLSEILNGKVGLSEKQAFKLVEKLHLEGEDKKIFIDLVLSVSGRNTLGKKIATERLNQRFNSSRQIKVDEFSMIADWYHVAILELMSTDNFDSSADFISKRLGISKATAEEAMERLLRLGLLEQTPEGLKLSEKNRSTENDIPSQAVRDFNRQILQKATDAIETQSVDERDFASIIFPIPKAKIGDFKKLLHKLQNEFLADLDREAIQSKDSLYCLSTQLFELTEKA